MNKSLKNLFFRLHTALLRYAVSVAFNKGVVARNTCVKIINLVHLSILIGCVYFSKTLIGLYDTTCSVDTTCKKEGDDDRNNELVHKNDEYNTFNYISIPQL